MKTIWSDHRKAGLVGVLTALGSLAACTAGPPLILQDPVGPEPPLTGGGTGKLVVYSATYAPVVEQSEYPVHTNYTISTPDDHIIERVSNATGPFFSYPAKVSLPAGEYHVRAQHDGGGFIIVPVVIAANKTTVVDLEHCCQNLNRPPSVGSIEDRTMYPLARPPDTPLYMAPR